MTTHAKEILQQPAARAMYRTLRQAAWLVPFLESESATHRRLGARLLIDELLDRLKLPPIEISDARRESAARREQRVEAQKRAAALYMAGMSFAQVGRELGISESKAARWARRGRTS